MIIRKRYGMLAVLVLGLSLALFGTPGVKAAADKGFPYPGTLVQSSQKSFDKLFADLKKAVGANKMGIVGQASASMGASRRGIEIPGNAVIGVYRNDFAVRMLQASVPAGIEAPLRFYVTENPGGGATLTYRRPSAVFAPYGNRKLDAMARELDLIFEKIAAAALR